MVLDIQLESQQPSLKRTLQTTSLASSKTSSKLLESRTSRSTSQVTTCSNFSRTSNDSDVQGRVMLGDTFLTYHRHSWIRKTQAYLILKVREIISLPLSNNSHAQYITPTFVFEDDKCLVILTGILLESFSLLYVIERTHCQDESYNSSGKGAIK